MSSYDISSFNVKKFLVSRLNNGKQYLAISDDKICGCIKGISYLACGGGAHIVGDVVAKADFSSFGFEVISSFPKFALALDIAEAILVSGYPGKAKLFLTQAIERYDLFERFPENNNKVTIAEENRRMRRFNKFNVATWSREASLVKKVKTRLPQAVEQIEIVQVEIVQEAQGQLQKELVAC